MGSESVKVVVRCRPLNARERALGSDVVLSVDLHRCQCFIARPGAADEPPKHFTFDGTYFLDQTTEQMYNETAYSLVEGVTEGYNGTIFAYGQTGSGKSFTMQGVSAPAAQRGVIPRAFEHIFESIQCAENTKFLVRASYLEIYNEEIRDLLGSDTKQRLELKEHPERGVYVRDLSVHTVHSVAECERIIERGWRNRAVGFTLMNKDSSRSHSIFTIHLEIYNTDPDGQDRLRAGKLNLVDLAGSERQSKTGATGERLREAAKINLSLSALGNVISALVDGRAKHVPYRDSKLTRLLQDSLGGNTRTLMIACLSPADNNYEESLSTLRYANRAKSIQNRPRINEDPKDALLREYQEEIRKLRALISGKLGAADLAPLPAGPVSEASPAGPSGPRPTNTEAEKIKEATAEYEVRLAKLRAEYHAEQESRAQLQEDIAALRSSFESKLPRVEKARASRGGSVPKDGSRSSSPRSSSGCVTEDVVEESGLNRDPMCHGRCGETPLTKATVPAASVQANPAAYFHDATARPPDQQHVLDRLQQLEQEVVGGEQARNNELKQRQRHRRNLADQRKEDLICALSEHSEDSENVLLNVYNSIQEEVHAKSQALAKVQGKLKAAKLEIRDLQAEFEAERDDYLASIRRLEREGRLLHGLLERMVPLVRRDCNYSNLDRLKKDAVWDEEGATWRLPEVVVQKTTLPAAVTPKLSTGRGPSGDGAAPSAADEEEEEEEEEEKKKEKDEEDRYKEMLDRSDSENFASSYFRSKRATHLLGRDAARGHVLRPPPPVRGAVTPPISTDSAPPRPFRLESLDVPVSNAKVRRKKSKSHIHSEGI